MDSSINPDGMRWRGVLLEDMSKDELVAVVLQLARSQDAERKQTIDSFAFLGKVAQTRAEREKIYAAQMNTNLPPISKEEATAAEILERAIASGRAMIELRLLPDA